MAGEDQVTTTIVEGTTSDQTQISGVEKTFTQAEVTAMMAKEKNQGRMSVLKELGVEDTKTAKDALIKHKEYLENQKTEVEKLQGESATEKSARLAAEQKVTLLEHKFEAMKLGVKPDCVDDIMALAQTRVTETKDFASAIGELKTKYPDFFGENPSGSGSEANKGTGGNVNSKRGALSTSGLGARLGAQTQAAGQKSSYFSK
ncbi:MAG: hypothetical protein RR490_08200 [Niameybacter sp.]